MVDLQTKNGNLGIFWKAWEWKYYVVIWYIFGMFYQEKSGNPSYFRGCLQ
jgi:hypothetical protein